jgi:hypothetical protein
LAQRSSRKRRKQRQRGEAARATGKAASRDGAEGGAAERGAARPSTARGYERSRAKDEAARAKLEPLAPGERPRAVTVGAIVAGAAAIANLVALIAGFEPGETQKTVTTAFGTALLAIVAVGMWRARYWAVLGMQTLLAITIVIASLSLLTAINVAAGILIVAIVGAAGTLFWFLVRAMARIQMPEAPPRRDLGRSSGDRRGR